MYNHDNNNISNKTFSYVLVSMLDSKELSYLNLG